MPRLHLLVNIGIAMTGASLVALLIWIIYNATVLLAPTDASMAADQSTLELLHVVFRHGARTPADTYPNDPHINQSFYPYGWGHITNNGKRELYAMGDWLRRRYGRFMGSFYHPDIIHAQATGTARTHMSLATVLAAIYPPRDTPMEWDAVYNWQPIWIVSQPLDEDTLLLVRKPCPRYYEARNEVLQLPQVQAEITPQLAMFHQLSRLTGLNITDPDDIQSLYLTLLAEKEFHLPLPSWTLAYFPERMQFMAEQSYVYNVYTTEMQRIKAGPFLRKMLNEMQLKRDNALLPADRKMFIYAGHDSTIVNVLAGLKVWQRQLPHYAAMIIFELHKNATSGRHYVEVYFRSSTTAPVQRLSLPGCQFQCPLEKLLEISRDVVPPSDDMDARCAPVDKDFTEPPLRGP